MRRAVGVVTGARLLEPTRFLPASDGSWVSVDPFTARVTRIDVARDARGGVQSLALGGDEPRGQRQD
jgi:hypothetical protein